MAKKTIDAASNYQNRRRGLLRLARNDKKLDAMLITDPVDIHYLCGLHEGSVSLLFGDDWSIVVTSPMFRDVAGPECPGTELVIAERGDGVEPPSDDELIGGVVKKRRLGKIGYEDNLLSVSRFRHLTKYVSEKKLVAFSGLTVGFRAVKESEEIETTRKAVKISERAFRDLMRRGVDYFVGKTEKQIATELEYLMRGYGADRQAFPGTGIIVAVGPNSASCHHLPSPKKIRRGDAVLIDWGAELDGYRSDMTRVLFIGGVPTIYEKIYEPVEKAMLDCIAATRPGVHNHSIDKIARDVIDQAGFGDKFPHGLGHGIGLQIHEQPRLTRGPVKPLKKNMIITIEPGIYFSGVGGARLEDDILVTADGHENLCSIPTALKKMVLT